MIPILPKNKVWATVCVAFVGTVFVFGFVVSNPDEQAMFIGLIAWAMLIAMIPGSIARAKGHSFARWWIYGVLLFIVALPASLLLKTLPEEEKTK